MRNKKIKVKYLFIMLEICDGEHEYLYRCTHVTSCNNIDFAAELYAARFWGKPVSRDGVWWDWGHGNIGRLVKAQEITKTEYEFLNNLFT